MKLGNIVYGEELVNHEKLDYINYLYNPSLEEINEVSGDLPTLYVGWKFFKKNIKVSGEPSILDKELMNDYIYWEFSFNENKKDSIDGVDKFASNVPNYYFKKKYTYVDLNPIFFNVSDINELFCILPKNIDKIYQHGDKMIYLLKDNKITGIDLNSYSYFNFNVYDIINKLKPLTLNYYFDEDLSKFIELKMKFNSFDNLKRYMICLI